MRGQLRHVVDRAFAELWQPLTNHDDCPANVFGEVFAGLRPFLHEPESEYVRQDDGTIRNKAVNLDDQTVLALSNSEIAENLLKSLSDDNFDSESDARRAISSTHSVLLDIATNDLAHRYLSLVQLFIGRYSLGYYVDEKARIWISFSGFAAALFAQIRLAAEGHCHLFQELNAFEQALAECFEDPSESHIKTVIQKQVNVLEVFGSQNSLVSGNTLGRMFEQVDSWPHHYLHEAAKKVYKFTCDYPGIRHSGNFESSMRRLDQRDLAGITFLLIGFIFYLTEDFEIQTQSDIQVDTPTLYRESISFAPWIDSLADSASNQ